MTEDQYDQALGDLAKRVLARLDTTPMELGMPRRQHYPHLGLSIPFSDLLSEDDLVNALHDAMRALKLDFAPIEGAS